MKYKISNVTDRAGNVREEFMAELKAVHPDMSGVLLYPISKKSVEMIPLCFVWADQSDKMLRTSTIMGYREVGNIITVTTRNSIYTLEVNQVKLKGDCVYEIN